MWHKKFIPLAIFITMLSSMGESLHALPGMDHESVVACNASNTHIDSQQDHAGQDCFLCQCVTHNQAVYSQQLSVRQESQVEDLVESSSHDRSQAVFSNINPRGPPSV